MVTEAPDPGVVGHPGPTSVALPASIREAIVSHARAEEPNEACGVIVGDRPAGAGGRALRFEPARNEAASRFLYRLDARDLLRLTLQTDDRDEVFWAIVHSHVRSAAYSRPTPRGAMGRRTPAHGSGDRTRTTDRAVVLRHRGVHR